ncbi:MAG: LPS export ABC transporter periplasmic protein LptC [Flavobacteriaceae bacterium]|nr:MAG: LPS export ABC transporter periplasmic protein LptC [Flavobacteriaceae bacterium]
MHILKSIATLFLVAILFSCKNNAKEVQDFLADKNLPIGITEKVHFVHTDSARVTMKMYTNLMLDFSNRRAHPYFEFPKGIKITTLERNGDSVTIAGDYALRYLKTKVSEIKQDVVIRNYVQKLKLETSQLYWDENTNYFFTDREFTFYTKTDTIYGVGFESKDNLSEWWVKDIRGKATIETE